MAVPVWATWSMIGRQRSEAKWVAVGPVYLCEGFFGHLESVSKYIFGGVILEEETGSK